MDLSSRLAAGQKPAKVIASLTRYLNSIIPNGTVATVTAEPAARARGPLVFAAVGLDADRIHAPNEYVDLSRLPRGAEWIACLQEELAA